MAISDKALFGLTVAQVVAEDASEAARMYGGLGKAAVRDDREAAAYTAEIMGLVEKGCTQCGRAFVGAPDEGTCPWCARTAMLEETLAMADKTLRRIGYDDRQGLRDWVKEYDPDGYYPGATAEDLRIHIARRAMILIWEGKGR